MFCGILFTTLPVGLSYAVLYFCASFPFYSFLGAVVCCKEFLFKQNAASFADGDEACKVLCHFLKFGRFLDFMSANIKKYYCNINV
jgi:hypothetical protein